MTPPRMSANARWFGVVTVLAMASSIASSWDPAPATRPAVMNLARLLPAMFPALSAQTVVTGCTNGNVASGNQITITLTRVAAVTTGGTEVLITDVARSVDLIGAAGSTIADKFFEGLTLAAGSYKQLNITMSRQMSYTGAVTCVIGGQTRYYYTNGSSDPPSPFVTTTAAAASAAAVLTQVTLGGANTPFELLINFEVLADTDTTVNILFDPVLAVYDTGSSVYAVFPASDATGATQP